MCAPVVNYTQKNCGIATEKLAFECHKSINAATANLHQQNLCIASGIVLLTIAYCTISIFCIRNSLWCVSIYKVLLDFLQYLAIP